MDERNKNNQKVILIFNFFNIIGQKSYICTVKKKELIWFFLFLFIKQDVQIGFPVNIWSVVLVGTVESKSKHKETKEQQEKVNKKL